jgi:phosphatidate cytidylyltransferase
MLGTRVVSGIALIAVVLGVLYLDEWFAPWFPFWLLLSVVALGSAAVELADLFQATGCRPSLNTVLGGVMAIVAANWMPHVSEHLTLGNSSRLIAYEPTGPISVFAWPLFTFVGVLMVGFLVQSVQFVKPGRTTATIATSMLAVSYIGLLGSFIIQMRWLDGPYHGIPPLVLLIATAKGADTGAYFLGRLAGRHKLWPSLSPNKTIEGAIGGMILAVVASLAVNLLAQNLLGIAMLAYPLAISFGLVVGVVAQLGDLMESMIKRDCERKDASAAVPGFGGVLDVLEIGRAHV